jgi:hypothetical protein
MTEAATDERFTLYLDAEGKPVQRRLGDMTADEVVSAIEWLDAEADRLDQLSAVAPLIVAQAHEKADRLARAVVAVLDREGAPDSGISLFEAIHRYWP